MNVFVETAACPLCSCPDARPDATPLPNLYSEMLAGLVGIAEDELLRRMANVRCSRCGLIYKSRRLAGDVTRRLFAECVPSHPRGWDVLSGRFTPDTFQAEVRGYREALDRADAGLIGRYRRGLASIVDSIPELEGSEESSRLLRAIAAGDTDTLRAADTLLREAMHEPAAYKRFSGFSATSLWLYVESTLGEIRSYAEVGCPLWGLLGRARERGRQAVYLTRDEPNYWSTECRQGGVHCVAQLVAAAGVATAGWESRPPRRYDAIGVFQYLDHLERPGDFLGELFERAAAAVVILDAVDQPLSVQHLTGWTREPMEWIADRFGCRLDADFADIRPSGNSLFVLQRF